MGMSEKFQSYLNNIAIYFKKSKSHSIGVDLGSNNLKIVELQKRGGKIKLKNYALVKMEKELSREELRAFSGQMVAKIFKDISVRGKSANIAIPSYSSLITSIEVSGRNDEEIKGEIEYEAAKYIPVDLEDVVFDWQIIEPVKEEILEEEEEEEPVGPLGKKEAEIKKRVLLVSVMKSISDQYQESFEKEGLGIDCIEVDCFSMKRSLLPGQGGSYLILDIGDKVTNIIGVYNDQILFNQNIDLAGRKITKLIAKSLKISEERAEKVKIEQGFESDSEIVVKNILEPVLNSIVEQAEKNIGEFEEFKKNPIEGIVLSGGVSQMKGLKDYVQNKTGKKVVFGNPWSLVEYPEKLKDQILASSPFFGVAVGLALIDLIED